LKTCLSSIIEYTDLSDVEIVVVANGAEVEIVVYVSGLADQGMPVRLIWFDRPIGATCALNRGIEATTGEYVIVINDDVILLGQPKNLWLDMMLSPFVNERVGITGPLKTRSPATNCEFILFFCAAIRRKLFDEIGLFDEIFNPGAGEDMDFAMKAKQRGYSIVQVPHDRLDGNINPKFWSGDFPIYHKAEGTVHVLSGVAEHWSGTLARNFDILRKRYGYARGEIEFSIIIPTCSAKNLQECVSSIVANSDLSKGEVIVVANGAEKDAEHFVNSLGEPFRLVWFAERIGATRALNEGIKVSYGKYLIFLNDDAVILSTGQHWIPLLIDPLRVNTVMVTGPMLGQASDVGRDFILFFCAAVDRELFNKVGLFDEVFNPGGFEDMDLCFKAQDLGYLTLQVPERSQLANASGLSLGNFPIYHMEHHSEWMTSEMFNRNREIIRKRYSENLIQIDWPCAQKIPELMQLQRLLQGRKIEKVVEVGVYRGGSAMFWAKVVAQNNGILYAVDQRFDWGAFTEYNFYYPRQVYNQTAFEPYVKEIEGDSHDPELIQRVHNTAGKVDVLFIDGDHTYEGVKQDYEVYRYLVKPGGLIVFHDIVDSEYHRSLGVYVNQLWEEIKHGYVYHEFIDPGEYPGCPGPSMGIGVLEVPL
jgi:GT2 family glycosyltransferase